MVNKGNCINVIPRLERTGRGTWTPILFLPDYPANAGQIVCYSHVGQHSEASLAYYARTRPARKRQCDALLAEYANLGPKAERLPLRVCKRRPSWRAKGSP